MSYRRSSYRSNNSIGDWFKEQIADIDPRILATAALMTLGGIYHHFATSKAELTNVYIRNKYTRNRLVRRGKAYVRETDYYIETDKGLMRDEANIFAGEFVDGDDYDKLEVGEFYNMETNHDDIFKTHNIMDVEKVPQPQTW